MARSPIEAEDFARLPGPHVTRITLMVLLGLTDDLDRLRAWFEH